jgi:hypothetical protein
VIGEKHGLFVIYNISQHYIFIRFGSSHNTPLSLEMVIACLEELGRGDIVEVIREEEEEKESPQVNDEDDEVDGEG